ncbi:MAG: aminotransferase class I/II-fold pyridoxal phosphate-dependent enzyme [Planctomycetes bacterium]|nr:aminotransferase class I/II-fold pyridoxal phosphate-dependent enzyme [Planctomycetota bacterium]
MHDPESPCTSTHCVHAGARPDAARPGVVPALELSTTYVLDDAAYALVRAGRGGDARIYARYGNPTIEALEARLAALEGAAAARVFASGMAALHGLLGAACAEGGAGHVVAARTIYGGTRDFLTSVWPAMGGRATFVDVEDAAALEAALADDARALLCESIANPTLEVADLPALAARCRAHGALLLVDATFATPALQRPLAHGADAVMHSASKYLGGHSDLLGGVVAGPAPLLARVDLWRRRTGGVLDPQVAHLLDRGLKTLALRMRAHCDGALRFAEALRAHPRVAHVRHPLLGAHAERARRLLHAGGGMVLLEVDGDEDAALRVLGALELALPAASLGGVETLVCTPATTSHAGLTTDARAALGIAPGAIRVSVGIEEPDDLVADFRRALDRA